MAFSGTVIGQATTVFLYDAVIDDWLGSYAVVEPVLLEHEERRWRWLDDMTGIRSTNPKDSTSVDLSRSPVAGLIT